jgi:hypothetical protein
MMSGWSDRRCFTISLAERALIGRIPRRPAVDENGGLRAIVGNSEALLHKEDGRLGEVRKAM